MDNRTPRPNTAYGAEQARRPQRQPNRQPVRRPAQRTEPDEPQRGQAKRPRSENRWFRAIIMVMCTVGVCVFLAIFLLQSANDLLGLNQPDEQIEVSIPRGATVAQVTSILSEAGIVDTGVTFRLYAGFKDIDTFHAGDYVFNSNNSYDEILIKLTSGNSLKETVTLVFIEGRNVYEIAKELEEAEVCEAQEFLDCLENEDFGYAFMDRLPDDARRFRRLEGYVFPDTYEFYVGENVGSVARKFLRNFDSKITSAHLSRMNDLNLTLDETITLASIIQKEAGSREQMRTVSSVFHNRLSLQGEYPNLQSDVTIFYVNDFIIPFHTNRDQPMYDAYNTYVTEGLPIGPICNPGIEAIEAALYPNDTDYYFFVTDVQDEFYFATNAADHYSNIRTANAVEGEGEIHGVDTQ